MLLFNKLFTFFFISVVIVAVKSQNETFNEPEDDLALNGTLDIYITEAIKEVIPNPQKKVNVKLYYESLCPFCRDFGQHLKIYAEELHEYIDLQLYPYGNADTGGRYGHYTFDCQHGEEECYGNKLHACAIDILNNITQAVSYTSCMMDPMREEDYGSNDAAADECAESMSLDSGPIKNCAKSSRGSQLLKNYGDETDEADIDGVPHILINGVESNSVDFAANLTEAILLANVDSSQHHHKANIYFTIVMSLILLHKSLECLR